MNATDCRVVLIRDLVLQARIGIFAHEQGAAQRVRFNIELGVIDRPPRQELTFRRKAEDQNFLVKFPLGLRSGDFKLPKGLIQGQKLTQLLRRLTLPVIEAPSFDALPTPFRAVATDLETGEAVVLDRGDGGGRERRGDALRDRRFARAGAPRNADDQHAHASRYHDRDARAGLR